MLPDFALIAIGYLLCHHTALDRPVWNGAERLVYYLLFPALLFVAIVRQPLALSALASLGAVGLGITACGIALAYALRRCGSYDQLIRSVRTKIFPLLDSTKVYPGHGPETTVGRERRTNPFFQ